MGKCQSANSRNFQIDSVRKKYPLYHEINTKENGMKEVIYNKEIYTNCIKFIELKKKLFKANHYLYKKLFDRKNQSKRLEIEKLLENEDQTLFYFFVNKRILKELIISDSRIQFPRFGFQYFPKEKEDSSTLAKLTITNSIIQFDNQITNYCSLENVILIELSFCNIELIPDLFCKIKSLQKLCLRRNLLKKLPKLFSELKELIELDLSENQFTVLSKEIDFNKQKITILNMNANMIESFDYIGNAENSKLEFLFLAQNAIAKIPYDINKFRNLKFVNLDENNIADKSHNTINEIQLNIKISCFKNKGINEMIEIKKQEGAMPKQKENIIKKKPFSKLLQQQSILIENLKKVKTVEMQTIDTINQSARYDTLKIKNPKTQIEHEIACLVNGLIEESLMTNDKNDFEDKKRNILERQYFFMIEKVEHLISIGREKELGAIENYELKYLFKKCYETYLKKKEYNNTGVLPCKIDEMDYLEKQYFIKQFLIPKANNSNNSQCSIDALQNKTITQKNNKIKQREDVSNLIFLKHINQLITSSKITMFLQYLSNIDDQIRINILKLWESNDNNGFILILTELKLFLKEMIDYYNTIMKKGFIEVKFNVITSKEKNVIHM